MSSQLTTGTGHGHAIGRMFGLSAMVVALALPATAFAGDPDSVLVRLDVTRKASEKTAALAVRVAPDLAIAACSALSDASSIDAGPSNKATIVAIDVLDDLCELTGLPQGNAAALESRAAVLVGNGLIAYTPDPGSALGWNEHSVTVRLKLNDGFHRVVYIEGDGTGQPNGSREASGIPLFNGQGHLIGLTTHSPGAADVTSVMILEDLKTVTFKKVVTRQEKTPGARTTPGSLLAPAVARLGARSGYNHLAAHLSRIGDSAKLLSLADKWIAEDPDNPMPHIYAASAYQNLNFMDRSAAEVDKVTTLAPAGFIPRTAVMVLRIAQKRMIDAEMEARQIVQLQGTDSLDEGLRVRALLVTKDLDQAVLVAHKMTGSEPTSLASVGSLCEAESAAGHVDQAIVACRHLTELTPDSIRGLLVLSSSYLRLWKLDEALEAAKRALELNQDVAPSWAAIALAYEAMGNTDRADEGASAVERLDERMVEGFRQGRGAVACRREMVAKSWGRAIERCRRAADANPKDAFVRMLLGNALVQDRQMAQAMDALKDATRLDPKFTAAWVWLVYASLQNHDIPSAKDAYEKVKSLDAKQANEIRLKAGSVLDR